MSDGIQSMFTAAELGQALSKEDYAERQKELRVALINAQYDLQHAPSSVLLLIAGDDRLGAIDVLKLIHEWMDSRYIRTHAFGPPTEAERLRPEYWRYWTALPPYGGIGIYLGAFAQGPLAARVRGEVTDVEFDREIERFKEFERALTANHTRFVKLWVHLPKKEHEKRIAKAKKNGDGWRLDEVDWRICDAYDQLAPVAEDMLRRTTSGEAPWEIVEATDTRHRNVACAEHILRALERAIETSAPAAPEVPRAVARGARASVLDAVDLTATLPYDEYKGRLEKGQRNLFKLGSRAAEQGIRTLLVFEGWDAAGKGGVIRRLAHALDARDYRVVPIAAPTAEEQRYHYLWRFWRHVPRAGKLVVFDRSWYGRVLVERVEGLASEVDWQRAYPEINAFEGELVEADTVLLKFWLHIDPDEQLERFKAREQTPYKKYKITEEDYRNRERWGAYVGAVHDMVERTSTPGAPWHLVPANDKRFARVQVLETVCDALKRALKK